MLNPRTLLPVLLVPVAFGAGLLLAGGEEPEADAGPVSAVKTIDVADRAVDIPGVKAVRLPALRDEPEPDTPAATPSAGSSSTATEQPTVPSTSNETQPTAPTPSTGGSGSTSGGSGSTSTPKQESGSTSGAVEEGSTGS